MSSVYFIDANAAGKGIISGLKCKLKTDDEVHIFGGLIPKVQQSEVKEIENNVTLHLSAKTIRQRVDFELVALYSLYAAANTYNKHLYVISKSTQVLQTIDEMKRVSCI